MSDVFISYAREDRSLAQELANHMQSEGFNVWWDTELLGSDDFNDVIAAELTKARATVVIWSNASVKSLFVRDEARFALARDKLVATKLPNLDVESIPFGFQGQHTDDVSNYNGIVRAIEKLGARRSAGTSASAPVQTDDDQADWERVKRSDNPDDLIAFLAAHPQSGLRQPAKARLRDVLVSAPNVSSYQRVSKLSALFSGLTFRIPDFLPTASGQWAAIGLAIGYVFALLAVISLTIAVEQSYGGKGSAATFSICAPIVAFFGLIHFHKLVSQRLQVASNILVWTLALLCLAFVAAFSSLVMDPDQPERVYIVFAVPIVWLLYAYWRIWRAR